MGYKPSKILEDNINSLNIKNIRIILTNIILSDRGFNKGLFDEALEYVVDEMRKRGVDKEEKVLQDYIKKEDENKDEKKNYSSSDFEIAMVELENNFCQERIDYLKKLGKELYCDTNGIEGTNKSDEKKTIITQMNQSKPSQMSKKQEKKIGVVGWILLGIGAAATVITIVEIVKHLKK